MQRSHGTRSSQESAGCARLCSSRAVSIFFASDVNGSLPSFGSTISDVRMFAATFPRSNQCALYAPVSPGLGGASSVLAASRAAASWGVKNSLSFIAAGRSSGVRVPYDYVPWRSGSPHGVFFTTYVFVSPPPFVRDDEAWPERGTAASHTTATSAPRMLITATNRLRI